MNNPIDDSISDLAIFANQELGAITQMGVEGFPKANRIDPRQFRKPTGRTPQSEFIEQPTSNYAGSEPAYVGGGMPNFIPIPADLQEAVLRQVRPDSTPQPQSSPQPKPRPEAQPQPQPQAVQQTQNIPQPIPDGFDFDLFQYAILKDISCNIEKILVQIEEAKKQFEAKKTIIDKALLTSKLSKK